MPGGAEEDIEVEMLPLVLSLAPCGNGLVRDGPGASEVDGERETTQAIGQQHTSPLRARCEARRREVVLIFCCGEGLVRYGPGASEVDGRLRAGGPQGL